LDGIRDSAGSPPAPLFTVALGGADQSLKNTSEIQEVHLSHFRGMSEVDVNGMVVSVYMPVGDVALNNISYVFSLCLERNGLE
jgi:hypothetical protein